MQGVAICRSWRRATLWGLVSLCWGLSGASAGLLVAIPDAEVGSNGRGRAEVLISSDSASDRVAGFVLHFELSSENGRVLEFFDAGQGVAVDSHLWSPRYVFASTGSAARDNPPAGAIGPGTTYTGIDVSNAQEGVAGVFTDRLLVTLHFDANQALAPQIGDLFRLELDLGQSEFFDPDGNLLSVTSVRQGTVVVTPEPGGWLLAGVGLMGWLICRRNGLKPGY